MIQFQFLKRLHSRNNKLWFRMLNKVHYCKEIKKNVAIIENLIYIVCEWKTKVV